jgi:hypothetical protein
MSGAEAEDIRRRLAWALATIGAEDRRAHKRGDIPL